MTYILGDFLRNPARYHAAREYWEALWTEILQAHWLEGAWDSPWIDDQFEDGNPIFSAVNVEKSAGLRIVQLEPSDSGQQLATYLDTSEAQGKPITELVIACEPTDEMMPLIRRVLYEWASCPVALETIYSRFSCRALHSVPAGDMSG